MDDPTAIMWEGESRENRERSRHCESCFLGKSGRLAGTKAVFSAKTEERCLHLGNIDIKGAIPIEFIFDWDFVF